MVDVKSQSAYVDRVSSVEDGIEVGQDNLGMDSVEEETKSGDGRKGKCFSTREKILPGTTSSKPNYL